MEASKHKNGILQLELMGMIDGVVITSTQDLIKDVIGLLLN